MAAERSTNSTPVRGQAHPPPSFAETSVKPMSTIPNILPHERVFPVQIGTELFKLSGASLSSDAPSYFSQYFRCQFAQAEANGTDPSAAIHTLYIDRDPATFRDIALHLQGYHVTPRCGEHFVRLFADAQFYSLPKLISQLYEEPLFMSIGHREFQIPRNLFSDPGNSPNFFTLGFAFFFSNPGATDANLFPGLEREGLIRPPSILPPSVPGRSAETFAELLHLLRGYPLHVRDESHRAELLRDCRYFNFKGLEQRLIPHARSFNQSRGRDEIVLRLEDILKSGISVVHSSSNSTTNNNGHVDVSSPLNNATVGGIEGAADGWVHYARPYVDPTPAELVLEIGGENMRLHFLSSSSSTHQPPSRFQPASSSTTLRVEFFRDARTRISKLFEVLASKLNLPATTAPLGLLMAAGGASSQPATPGTTPLSGGEDWVKCVVGSEAGVVLDGRAFTGHVGGDGEDYEDQHWSAAAEEAKGPGMGGLSLNSSRKRRRADGGGWVDGMGQQGDEYWVLKTGQWRLRIQSAVDGRGSVECVLVAVKLDAVSGEHARNEARGFLSG